MSLVREFLADTSLFVLPIVAMCLFLAMFVTVLLRVAQRRRQPEYRRMATLPLDDDIRRSPLS